MLTFFFLHLFAFTDFKVSFNWLFRLGPLAPHFLFNSNKNNQLFFSFLKSTCAHAQYVGFEVAFVVFAWTASVQLEKFKIASNQVFHCIAYHIIRMGGDELA